MDTTRLILAIVILIVAAYVVAMNWGCVIVSIRNRRRGIDRHHSTVPIISVILVALASLVYPKAEKSWMILIPVLDIANWNLLALPIVLFREWRKGAERGTPPDGHLPSPVDASSETMSSDSSGTPSSGDSE